MGAAVGYIAGRDLLVGSEIVLDDETGEQALDENGHGITREIWRRQGEVVPEAENWPDVRAYVNAGHLLPLPTDEAKQVAANDQTEAAVRDLTEAFASMSETIEAQGREIEGLGKKVVALEKSAHTHNTKQPTKETK